MANTKNCPPADFLAQFQSQLGLHIKPGQRLCVAFSGGVDSVVLLHATAALIESLQIGHLLAVHVHHGLSPNAEKWADFCQHFCDQLGVKFELQRVNVHPQVEGVEAAARKVRYAALEASNCDLILLGHHQDDQAETVLLNLLRGAGVHGAAGMLEARGRLLRPLLGFSREQIVAYANKSGLSWIEDESNSDTRYSRNFLRGEAFPLLRQRFPQAASSLARAAQTFADSAELLDEIAKEDLGAAKLLHVDQLKALSSSRAANLLAYYLRQHDLMIPSSAMLREMLRQLLTADRDSEICFNIGGRDIRRFREQVFVERAPVQVFPVIWSRENELSWGSYRIQSKPVFGDGIAVASLENTPLRFSPRHGGDVLRLRHEGPQRPLKDILREAGIPPWRRKTLPVLYAGEEVVWVAGIGVASKYRCKPEAEGILIEFDGVTW